MTVNNWFLVELISISQTSLMCLSQITRAQSHTWSYNLSSATKQEIHLNIPAFCVTTYDNNNNVVIVTYSYCKEPYCLKKFDYNLIWLGAYLCSVGRCYPAEVPLCAGGSGVCFSPLTERQELTSPVTHQHTADPHSGDEPRFWNSSRAVMLRKDCASYHMQLPINSWPVAV